MNEQIEVYCYANEILKGFEELFKLSEPERIEVLRLLSKHRLEQLETARRQAYQVQYGGSRRVPLFNVSRTWTKDMTIKFFQTFPEDDLPNAKKLLLRQFFYGLRIGESTECELMEDIGMVRVSSRKKGRVMYDFLPIIKGTESLFQLKRKKGPHKELDGYNAQYLADCFKAHCKTLGAPYWSLLGKDKRNMTRVRYTSHTLRKTAGNIFREHTRDIYKEAVFLRHSIQRQFGVTSHYVSYPEEQFRTELNDAFADLVQQLVPKQ